MLFDTSNIIIDRPETGFSRKAGLSISVLRLDKIHPVVSGNKLFKLHYFLEQARSGNYKRIITFGGAYSNHLLATAFACSTEGYESIGIVRGNEPDRLSHTLQRAMAYGMQLKFISREMYTQKDDLRILSKLFPGYEECFVIPEGGYHPIGAKGAALILDTVKKEDYSHICTATGTATTLAGLLLAARHDQSVIGIPVLKGLTDLTERIAYLTGKPSTEKRLRILEGSHFGGYAKRTSDLIRFMNDCWLQFRLPLDFVYTAKMLHGVFNAAATGQFESGSNILCLHTGGLQGNDSLPAGSLCFR